MKLNPLKSSIPEKTTLKQLPNRKKAFEKKYLWSEYSRSKPKLEKSFDLYAKKTVLKN